MHCDENKKRKVWICKTNEWKNIATKIVSVESRWKAERMSIRNNRGQNEKESGRIYSNL